MHLRIVSGTVARGREADFVEICRREVAAGARAPGLMGFLPGYRRVGGVDRFALASTWQTEADAQRTAGTSESSRASAPLTDIATIERVDQYEVVPPVFGGIVDAPGGVMRLTRASIRPGRRDDLYEWLSRHARESRTQRLLLGWAIGERDEGSVREVVSVSVWPSPLVVEEMSESGRHGKSLFASLDEFLTETRVEQYQSIGLELPTEAAVARSRRMLAARFETRAAADTASELLRTAVASSREVPDSVAPLGAPGSPSEQRSWILVTRVSVGDYAAAERLVADNGGEVILTARESPTEAESGSGASGTERSGSSWSVAPAD